MPAGVCPRPGKAGKDQELRGQRPAQKEEDVDPVQGPDDEEDHRRLPGQENGCIYVKN